MSTKLAPGDRSRTPLVSDRGRPLEGDVCAAIVERHRDEISSELEPFDPEDCSGEGASRFYKALGALERLVQSFKALASRPIEESGVWKAAGEGSCASFLATLDGAPRGQARATLDVGRALSDLPLCHQMAREGRLSQAKLVELTNTLKTDPTEETALLSEAETEPLWSVRERCQRARAASSRRDPAAAARRIHAGRHVTWWSDAEGAFCFQGRDTADRGAIMRARLEELAADLRRARARATDEPREADGALRADALFALLAEAPSGKGRQYRTPRPATARRRPSEAGRGAGGEGREQDASVRGEHDGSGHSVVNRPPRCTVMVRVDLDALLRGRVRSGECCEVDGHGPIPAAMARDLTNDSYLRLVFHRAGEIRAVSSMGRTVKRPLRIALAARDRCCVVPGCNVSTGLEIDHIVPFAEGGPTELDNLALLCHHHHFLKTFDGWTLQRVNVSGKPQCVWEFRPPLRA